MEMTECAAFSQGGTPRVAAALVSTVATVPCSPTKNTFPWWVATGNVDSVLLKNQTGAYTQKHQPADLLRLNGKPPPQVCCHLPCGMHIIRLQRVTCNVGYIFFCVVRYHRQPFRRLFRNSDSFSETIHCWLFYLPAVLTQRGHKATGVTGVAMSLIFLMLGQDSLRTIWLIAVRAL